MMKSIKKASELLKFPAYTPGVSGPMPSSALRPNADIVPLSGTHVEHLLHVDPTMEPDFRCRNKYRTHFYLLEEPDRVTNAINLRSIFDEYVGFDSNEKGMCSHTAYVENGLRGLYINSTVTYVSTAHTTKVTGTKIEVDCDLMTVSKSTVDKYHVWSNLALDARVMCSSCTQGVTKMDLDNRFLYQAPVTHQAPAACSTIITGIILREATPVNPVIWIATAHPYANDILSSVLGTSTHMIVFTHKFYSAEAHLCFGGYYFLAGPSFPLISQSIAGALVWGVVVSSIHCVIYPSHLLHFWAQKFAASVLLATQLQHDNQLHSAWGGLVQLAIASQDVINMRILMSINSCVLLDFMSADMFPVGQRTSIDRMFSNFNKYGSQLTDCQVIKRLTTHPPDYAFALFGIGPTFRRLRSYASSCGVYYYMTCHPHRCVFWLECRFIELHSVILKIYGESLHDNMSACAHCSGFSMDNAALIGPYDLSSVQSSGMSYCASSSRDTDSIDMSCALRQMNGELVQHNMSVCVYHCGHHMGGAIIDRNDLSPLDDTWITCVFDLQQYDDHLFDKTSMISTVASGRSVTSVYDCRTLLGNNSRLFSSCVVNNNHRFLLKLNYLTIDLQLKIYKEHYKFVKDNISVGFRCGRISVIGLIPDHLDSTPLALPYVHSEIENEIEHVGSSYDLSSIDAAKECTGNASDIIRSFNDFDNRLPIIIGGNCHLITFVMDADPSLRDLPCNFNVYIIVGDIFSFLHGESFTSNYQFNHGIYLWGNNSCDSCSSYGSNDHTVLVSDTPQAQKSFSKDNQTSTWASLVDRFAYMDLTNDSITIDIINDRRMIDSTAVDLDCGELLLGSITQEFQELDYDPCHVMENSDNIAGFKTHPIDQTTTTPHFLACYHRINTRCVLLPMILLPSKVLRGILPLGIATSFRAFVSPEYFGRHTHDQVHDQDLSNHDQAERLQPTTKLQVTTIPSHNDVDVAPSFGVVQYLCFVRATVFGLDCHHLPLTIDNCLIKWGALWGAILARIVK